MLSYNADSLLFALNFAYILLLISLFLLKVIDSGPWIPENSQKKMASSVFAEPEDTYAN